MALNVLISSSCRAGREKVRAARLALVVNAKRFALRAQNTPNFAAFGLAGRDFSRRLALRPGLVGDVRHY